MVGSRRWWIIALLGLAALSVGWVQQGGLMEYGETVEGRVTGDGPERWIFSGREGDEVLIEMHSESFDTYLELLDADGNVLVSNDDSAGTDSLIAGFVLPQAGRYTIQASSYSGETGQYSLSLERTDSGIEVGVGGGPLDYGDTVEGRLTTASGDQWTFSGEAGDQVRIAMRSDVFDSYLDLMDPGGLIVSSNDDSGGELHALIEGFVLAESGTHTIVARSFSGGMGGYTLSLERTAEGVELRLGGGQIAFDETVEASLGSENRDEWTFAAAAGDVVTIRMTSGLLDSYLVLEGPDGETLTEDDDGGGDLNARIENYWLEEGGTYTIVASSLSGQPGPYRLRLDRVHAGSALPATLLVGGMLSFSLLCFMALAVAGAVAAIVLLRPPRK